MEIRENKDICIIAPICKKLDNYKIAKIVNIIKNEHRKIALDLAHLEECSFEFIEQIKAIKNPNVGLFNIPDEIFILFNITNLDKAVKLYVSELDFEEDARQIINRKFKAI